MPNSHTTQPQNPATSPLRQILSPIRGQLFLATLLAAIGAMLTLLPLFIILKQIKTWLHTANVASNALLDAVILPSLVSLLLAMLLLSLSEMLSHMADQRISYQLRMRMTERLSLVPLGWFSQHSSGQVKQVLQDDIGLLHSLTAHFFPVVGRTLGIITIVLGYLFWSNWCLSLLMLLPFLGFVWYLRQALHSGAAHMPSLVDSQTQLNSATVEFSNAIPVIKTFAGQAHTPSSYPQAVENFAQAFIRFTHPLVAAMAHAHAMIASLSILAMVLLCGAVLIHFSWMAAVDLLPFLLLAPLLSAPVLLLHNELHGIQASHAAAQRVLQLLETPALTMPTHSQHAQIQDHGIRIENLSYGYTAQHLVLKQINLDIKPNSVTALVGISGAGKTTLAQLLLRFFDPNQGCIRLGGVDLRDIHSCELYQRIGFVLQESQLIHASIADNIALGQPTATQQQIEQAAKLAQIHTRILALKDGYHTVLGTDVQLSGGERQRLCLARALLLDPPILILDEATAALDIITQQAIDRALTHFVQGRTVLIVAHRLETIMHAQHIVLLDAGQIAEQGTHAELLAKQQRYAQLWQKSGDLSHGQTGAASCSAH